MIAAPWFISGEVMEMHSIHRRFFLRQQSTHPVLHLLVPYIDVHFLGLDEMPDQLRVNRWHSVVFVGKAYPLRPRPGEPRGDVLFPLRRHSVAKLTRCFRLLL